SFAVRLGVPRAANGRRTAVVAASVGRLRVPLLATLDLGIDQGQRALYRHLHRGLYASLLGTSSGLDVEGDADRLAARDEQPRLGPDLLGDERRTACRAQCVGDRPHLRVVLLPVGVLALLLLRSTGFGGGLFGGGLRLGGLLLATRLVPGPVGLELGLLRRAAFPVGGDAVGFLGDAVLVGHEDDR